MGSQPRHSIRPIKPSADSPPPEHARVHRLRAARAFGLALKSARLQRGLSQEELAERGEFDRTYPSLLERGRRSPTFFVILQLAYALRMEPVALFGQAIARLQGEAQS
jgi:ribosome-binding protein aMBF1 (putative translation factor)